MMKGKIFIITIAIFLISCSPQKRLVRLLEKNPDLREQVLDSVLVYRDFVDTVRISGDTIRDSVYIQVEGDMPDTTLKTRSTYAEASAGISGGEFWLELRQIDTMIIVRHDSVVVEKEVTKTEVQIVEVEKEVKTGVFWRHGFLILAGLILVGLVLFFLLR